MKRITAHSFNLRISVTLAILSIAAISLAVSSFTVKKAAADFMEQLGITKASADEKITNSLLGGYLDQYGLRNAKNIAAGDRAAVARDLLLYTKQYINGPGFQKAYLQLRDNNKPKANSVQSPDEMRTGLIDQYKKSITETEANMKKADANMKAIFEPILITLKQQLKDAQDPDNVMLNDYKKNYPEMLKSLQASNQQQLAEWEAKYPANDLLFVKIRLEQFLNETASIDFNAQLIEKNGKKYFATQADEHKSNRWKLGFRAGKDVVETARALVKTWIGEIK